MRTAAARLLLPALVAASTLSLTACETEPPAPAVAEATAEELSAELARVFCLSANLVWQDCSFSGDTAAFQGRAVRFGAAPTSFMVLEGKTIGMGSSKQEIPGEVQLGFEAWIEVDGRRLIAGKVSHAASDADLDQARAKAMDEAAQRFVVGHGTALVDALIAQPGAPALAGLGLDAAPQRVGETAWQGWASYPVVKGQGFDPSVVKKMAPQVRSMVREVGPYLEGLAPDGVHAVKIVAKLGGGGAPGPCGIVPPTTVAPGMTVSIVPLAGEVFVNGEARGDICTLSEPVAWPLPQGGATLEWTQVIVVAPAQPDPEGRTEPDAAADPDAAPDPDAPAG